ncbi:MAG: hypothetical protein ACNS60_10600 [Candidatus Cyclobacteriaceae bacterium M2_1C_046]
MNNIEESPILGNKGMNKVLADYDYKLKVRSDSIKVTKNKLSAFLPLFIFPLMVFGAIMGWSSEEGTGEISLFEDFWTGIIDAFIVFGSFMFFVSFLTVILKIYKALVFKFELKEKTFLTRTNGITKRIPLAEVKSFDLRKNYENNEYSFQLYITTSKDQRIKLFSFGSKRVDGTADLTRWKEYLEKATFSAK